MTPLVSILIPVYNRVSLVGETIESARNQTYQNIEIIIVDNCSTDGTWDLLKDYAVKDNRIQIFQNPENIGPVRNWKRCIDEAKGEYAKILFSDDLIAENFIEETLLILDSNTEIGFVISRVILQNLENLTAKESTIKFPEIKIFSRKKFIYGKIYGFNNFPNSPGCSLFRTCDLKNNHLMVKNLI